ncbi:MAG: type II toxin-antitoxin system HicB family antitoxin [Candidatus Aminicenantes bacterium]|nr:type II toxin-antitoxin system HicB family antitoxin [Candidatus Aminicenantes bacterium]
MWLKKRKLTFEIPIIIEPDNGEFYAHSPALSGLHVGGKTEEEALVNAVDAAIAYLKSIIKHGEPIPIGIECQREHKPASMAPPPPMRLREIPVMV